MPARLPPEPPSLDDPILLKSHGSPQSPPDLTLPGLPSPSQLQSQSALARLPSTPGASPCLLLLCPPVLRALSPTALLHTAARGMFRDHAETHATPSLKASRWFSLLLKTSRPTGLAFKAPVTWPGPSSSDPSHTLCWSGMRLRKQGLQEAELQRPPQVPWEVGSDSLPCCLT